MAEAVQRNLEYKKYVVDSRLRYFKPHASRVEGTFAEEICSSLGREPKSIHPKFFYDQRGSALFEEICSLPEYYQYRTEAAILESIQQDLAEQLDGRFRLVELGSGASAKTRLVLDVLAGAQRETEYVPIDISDILAESSERLLRDYDSLSITGIIDTYEGGLEFLGRHGGQRSLILFLGSSFGNFAREDGAAFMEMIRSAMRPGDLLLIGLDLAKDKAVLEAAYDDSQGVTAKFNLNVLSRINDELDADFDLENFEHYSTYNEKEQRIEMYLRSLANQHVIVSKSNLSLRLTKGELIHTEYSYKYAPGQIRAMLEESGLRPVRTWTDGDKKFSLTLAARA